MFARAFAISWVAYFGYYLCRKNFSVLMPYLKSECGLSSADLAAALFAYSLLYAVGQFGSGYWTDQVGARLVAGTGMLVSALASSLLAWPVWVGAAGVILVLAVNGAAQSTGWPSVLKLTRDWFPAENRGVWLGWWSTHMVAGGFAGTWLAARLSEADWTRAAWVPGVALAGIAVMYLAIARDKPVDVVMAAKRGRLVLTGPLAAIGAMYFCVKLTRYAFLFWLPLYMTEHLQYAKPLAGYASSGYEMIGIFGALAAGYASERTGGSRFPVGAWMMLVLAVLCATYPAVSAMGLPLNLAWIGLIGFFTFGPDTLMAAAAIHDAVPAEATASAAGFVNGVGSLGQVLSPMAVAYLTAQFGWTSLFMMLSLLVLCGALALATQCIRIGERKQEAVS